MIPSSSPLLEYERTTHFPTRRGNLRVRVDSDGSVYAQKNDLDPPRGDAWSADFPAKPLTRLADAVALIESILDRHGFFSLDPIYRNANSTDGSRERLAVHCPRGDKVVEVDRASVAAFRAAVTDLFHALGVDGRSG